MNGAQRTRLCLSTICDLVAQEVHQVTAVMDFFHTYGLEVGMGGINGKSGPNLAQGRDFHQTSLSHYVMASSRRAFVIKPPIYIYIFWFCYFYIDETCFLLIKWLDFYILCHLRTMWGKGIAVFCTQVMFHWNFILTFHTHVFLYFFYNCNFAWEIIWK